MQGNSSAEGKYIVSEESKCGRDKENGNGGKRCEEINGQRKLMKEIMQMKVLVNIRARKRK